MVRLEECSNTDSVYKLKFKQHPVFKDYVATSNGEVISLVGGKVLAKHLNKSNGYLYINFGEHYSVHRFVAEAFFGMSELEVNHKNKNRADNRLCNLEFVTTSQNGLHKNLGKRRYVYKQHGYENHYYIKIVVMGKLIPGGGLFTDKEEAYAVARELYKTHLGEYPW